MLSESYNEKLSHLLQYVTINKMTNLTFGGHHGFSPSTHLARLDGGIVDYYDTSPGIHFSLFFFKVPLLVTVFFLTYQVYYQLENIIMLLIKTY